MRCPHCQAEPPRDPFVCAHCGEQVLTYLDEPLGPGTGLRADEVGVSAGGRREPVGAGVATADDDGRSWLARQIDPIPPAGQGRPGPGGPVAPPPGRPAGPGVGSLVGKILFGLLVALLFAFRWELGSLLLVVGLALLLLRWPRLSFIPFAALTIALAGTLWVMIEIADALEPPRFFPSLIPTPQPPAAARDTGTVAGRAP